MLILLIGDINHLKSELLIFLYLGVTMDTGSTVASSNQLVSSSGVDELLWSCDLVYMITDHVIYIAL